MPDLSHLWQRFVLATALIFGLALGVAATVFGYSNTAPVNVGWSIFHLDGIPLWTVALVPLVFVLVAGTVYHWMNSLHHFSEHMRHRHRVHELEAEVKSLRGQLDKLLEMPDNATDGTAVTEIKPVEVDTVPANGDKAVRKARKRSSEAVLADTESIAELPATTEAEVEPPQEVETSPEA